MEQSNSMMMLDIKAVRESMNTRTMMGAMA